MITTVRKPPTHIVRKFLADAAHGEMPLNHLLHSAQPMAWFIKSDPRWEASLTSLSFSSLRSARRKPDQLGSLPKYRFELAVEGALVLRATLKGNDIQIDTHSPGPWESWFGERTGAGVLALH